MSNSAENHLGPDLNGKWALITGVGGFLGRALAMQLQMAGAKVAGLDILPGTVAFPSGIQFCPVDILNFNLLCQTVADLSADGSREAIVFHLAGQAHVGKCKENPSKAFALNVTGTFNILESCRRADLKRVIFPSTALVYALPVPLLVEESGAVEPRSFYAATKLAGESVLKGYSSDYGFASQIVRLGNVYGEGGPSDSLVSILLRQVQSGGPISLRTLAPVRDFIYRDDVVRGLIALAAQPTEPGCHIFNLSSGVATSIRELALLACRVGGLEPAITETAPCASDAEDRRVLSIVRLSKYARWRPLWTLEEGLRRTLSELRP
jgi:UDP-glucose 4-epimerase